METNYFALRDGKIVYVPDVPEKPESERVDSTDKLKVYAYALQSAITNGKEVENQKAFHDVVPAWSWQEGKLYSLQCRVEMIDFVRAKGTGGEWTEFVKIKRYSLGEGWETKTLARVTFDEQPEKNDVAPTQVETYAGTLHIGGDALGWQRDIDKWIDNEKRGIPPVSGREKAWRLRRTGVIEPEAAGQEQEIKQLIVDLLRFVESDGTVVNGFRTQEIVVKLRNLIYG